MQIQEISSMRSHIDALQQELLEVRQSQAAQRDQTGAVMLPSIMISEEPTISSIASVASSLQQQSISIDLDSFHPAEKGVHVHGEKTCTPKIDKDEMIGSTSMHAQENERLKAVISDMRMELEKLQKISTKPGSEDMGRLILELQESDNDLRQTMEHVEVLENQIQGNNMDTFQNQELPYLREKVKV